MSYAEEMAAGEVALAGRELPTAYAHFGTAHDLGHEVRRDHFAAHRAMIRTAWRARRPDWLAHNIGFLVLGFLFDWPSARQDKSVGTAKPPK